MTSTEVPIGAKVSVSAGIGYVRWTGANPKFSAGKWVGVELLEPSGKNNGTVQGEFYFDCKPNHGVFVRPSQVKILEAPKATASNRGNLARPPSTPAASRTASASSARPSPPKPPSSARAGPVTPAPGLSRTPSQVQARTASPPTVSRHVSSSSSTAMPPPQSTVPLRRPSSVMDTPAVASVTADRKATATPPHGVPDSRAASPALSERSTSGLVRQTPMRSLSSALAPSLMDTAGRDTVSASRPASPQTERASIARQSIAGKREMEELRIKIKILENRRSDDQEKIKNLEAKVGEADSLRAARVKLQAKFQELQTALVAAQRASRDLQAENSQLDSRATEATDQLEMAALDREVAEERAEAAEAEVQKLSERLAEFELEVAILKEENAEYEKPVEGIEGARTSLAFVQLEKHNERLKEALIRLRDVSAENERESKSRISNLEKELASHGELANKLELSEAKLANAESQVEDLKIQLDDALGAEDLLEQLTERNLQMSEKIDEMKVTIEDLEALKALNDELEENHVEAEKQLQIEIDTLTGQLRKEQSKTHDLNTVVVDLDATILQFRDLTTSLQSEIDELRMQQASQEFESATMSKEAQAIMNANLKLQTTAAKTQSRAIDLGLEKIEAAQLAEHLRIVRAYLPDAYNETEADSTALLLFFRRISSKVDLLLSTISQAHSLPASLFSTSSQGLVGICELRGKLRDFATLNERFAAVVTRSGSDDWVAYGKVLSEMTGVESRVDSWISSIRADQFNERDCARELSSLLAQFEHLASTSFHRLSLDVPEQQLGLAYTVDYDLDNFAAAVGFARQAVFSLAEEGDIEVLTEDSSMEEGIYDPVQRILDQVRTVKAASSKLVAHAEEVVRSASALPEQFTPALSDLSISVSGAVDLAVKLAQRIGSHIASIRLSKEPLRLLDIDAFLRKITAESAAPDMPPWEQIGLFIARLGQELAQLLPKIRDTIKSGHLVTVAAPPPWLLRVAVIKEAASHNIDTEKKVVKLSEELKDVLREVKLRDQSLQESGVKVEILERRLESTRKQADQILELESDVAKAKKQEKVYEDAIEQLQAEQDALEAENASLRKGQGIAGEKQVPSSMLGDGLVIAGGGVEAAQLAEQLENLRSAVRFLRSENSLLKSRHLYPDLLSLQPLRSRSAGLAVGVEAPVPELEPSSPTSPSSPSSNSSFPLTPPVTRHSLETERKLLFREITKLHSVPKIIDISSFGGAEDTGAGGGWRSRKNNPEVQMWDWRRKEKKLEKRVQGLKERLNELAVRR